MEALLRGYNTSTPSKVVCQEKNPKRVREIHRGILKASGGSVLTTLTTPDYTELGCPSFYVVLITARVGYKKSSVYEINRPVRVVFFVLT